MSFRRYRKASFFSIATFLLNARWLSSITSSSCLLKCERLRRHQWRASPARGRGRGRGGRSGTARGSCFLERTSRHAPSLPTIPLLWFDAIHFSSQMWILSCAPLILSLFDLFSSSIYDILRIQRRKPRYRLLLVTSCYIKSEWCLQFDLLFIGNRMWGYCCSSLKFFFSCSCAV